MRGPHGDDVAALSLRAVTAGYGAGPDVLRGLDLTLDGAGLWRVTGANGTGKSTLVELVSGYLRPRHGSVDVLGVPAHDWRARRRRRVCRSRVALHPAMSVADHLALAAMTTGARRSDLLARAEAFGLLPWLDAPAAVLSSGTARKAWFLLCTAGEFDLAVLDEPYEALDADAQALVSAELSAWAARAAVVLVTHVEPHGLPDGHRIALGTEVSRP